MIESSQLTFLIAVGQTGSFSKAAEHLQVTQSAISQSVKNLEKKLGLTLVVRNKKEVLLSPEGRKICQLGQKYFNDFDELLQSFYDEKKQAVGDYTIGTLDGIGKSFIAKYFLSFLESFPQINLQILLESPEGVLAQFRKKNMQAIILPEGLIPASLERHPLFDEYLCLLAHPKLLKGVEIDSMDFSFLKKLPYIFFQEQDPNFYQWVRGVYGQVPRGIRPRLIFNSYTPIIQAVKAGIGVAVIPSHVLNRPYFREQTQNLITGKEFLYNKICLAFHNELIEDRKTKELLQHLKSDRLL